MSGWTGSSSFMSDHIHWCVTLTLYKRFLKYMTPAARRSRNVWRLPALAESASNRGTGVQCGNPSATRGLNQRTLLRLGTFRRAGLTLTFPRWRLQQSSSQARGTQAAPSGASWWLIQTSSGWVGSAKRTSLAAAASSAAVLQAVDARLFVVTQASSVGTSQLWI